jgi:hypothetical protein
MNENTNSRVGYRHMQRCRYTGTMSLYSNLFTCMCEEFIKAWDYTRKWNRTFSTCLFCLIYTSASSKHDIFTDSYNSQQSWSSAPRGTNESARHIDLEHQSSHVKFWASSHVFRITLVTAVWGWGPHTSTTRSGESLLEGFEGCNWQAGREQDRQRTTICCEYMFILA